VKIESIGDTLIDGITCKILQKTMVFNDGFSSEIETVDLGKEFTYEDEKVIYYHRLGQFYVLYDFNAEAGDYWMIAGNGSFNELCDSTAYAIVDSTISLSINTIDLDGFYVSYPDTANWYMFGPVFEKLGNLSYMFPEPIGCVFDAYEGGTLRCYSDSEFGLYQKDTTPCDYIYMLNSIPDKESQFNVQIHPNPANNDLFITANVPVKFIIYDVSGRKIKAYDENYADIQYLKDGIYFIRVFDKKEMLLSIKKLIKS
jgi:hypothetical protein